MKPLIFLSPVLKKTHCFFQLAKNLNTLSGFNLHVSFCDMEPLVQIAYKWHTNWQLVMGQYFTTVNKSSMHFEFLVSNMFHGVMAPIKERCQMIFSIIMAFQNVLAYLTAL